MYEHIRFISPTARLKQISIDAASTCTATRPHYTRNETEMHTIVLNVT